LQRTAFKQTLCSLFICLTLIRPFSKLHHVLNLLLFTSRNRSITSTWDYMFWVTLFDFLQLESNYMRFLCLIMSHHNTSFGSHAFITVSNC